MKSAQWYRIGFVLLAMGVILGAFGAHALKKVLPAESLQAWQTAILYHFIHSLGLIAIARFTDSSKAMLWSARLLVVGLVCFSGSLYFLACKTLMPFSVDFMGPITPIGGVCWIAAWVLAAIGIPRNS
ncbi:MAG: hypothetical protein RLZZ262_581 [Bacteroidota bacterium]|jgi:uncharacterized membrane protein YgdD (TMEM256/DUF423 family)